MAELRPTASSMIDLKAELFRKQEEFKQLKTEKASDFVKGRKPFKHGKGDLWSKKNVGVLERGMKDLENKDEDDVMERSRKALEAKSRIYDKIAAESRIPDEASVEGYLVDFQKKAMDRILCEREQEWERKSEMKHDTDCTSIEEVALPIDSRVQQVEYMDSGGQPKQSLKNCLPDLDLKMQEHPLSQLESDCGLKLKETATLLSADMKRELRRQKWEEEAKESLNGPVHYANVQFDEIRTHGTGFYQFSKDNNLREKQMDLLNELNKQTVEGRERSERIKEKRKATLETRLAKIKQRRKLTGKEEGEDEDTTVKETKTDKVQKEVELLVRDDDTWRRNAAVREWDLGKEELPKWKSNMEEERNKRETEFAPPQFYYDKKPDAAAARRHLGNPSQCRQSVATSSSVNTSKGKMLNSTGVSPAASTVYTHTTAGRQESESKIETASVVKAETASVVKTELNLADIPLPRDWPFSQDMNGIKREVDNHLSFKNNNAHEIDQKDQNHLENRGIEQGPDYNSSSDVALISPGYILSTQQAVFQQPLSDAGFSCLPFASTMPYSTGPVITSDPVSDTVKNSISSYVYPSQQGVLMSKMPEKIIGNISLLSVKKKVETEAVTPEFRLLDKRFLQNREISDEDFDYSASHLTHCLPSIQPVSYVPGIFSSTAANPRPEDVKAPFPSAEITDKETLEQEVSSTPEHQETCRNNVESTEGVIFGVPDFLQPASNVATKAYQPGSFMAAKIAASQKAEEDYKTAQGKKQYIGAPVLYVKPAEESQRTQSSDS